MLNLTELLRVLYGPEWENRTTICPDSRGIYHSQTPFYIRSLVLMIKVGTGQKTEPRIQLSQPPKLLHKYACTLSLKLPQFCCLERHCFGRELWCSPYLLTTKNSIEICILSYVKQITSPGWMHETGCSGLVHWDDPEGWDGEGGGSGVQDGEHMYTHGWFMSMYGKNHYNIVK